MRCKRIVMTGLAAALLVFAAGCKTTQSTTTTTTPEATTQASTSSTSIGTGTMASSSTDNGTTATSTSNSTTSSSNLNSNTTTTTNTADNGTTTTLPNGTTVTKSQTTTIVYPNGTVKTLPGDNSSMASSSTDTTSATNVANLPPGAVVTKTTTTIKTTSTQPAAVPTTAYVPQPIYVTTTPANIYNPPPMTSSTTIYQPYRAGNARRFPGTNFLIFGSRASFSNSNDALSGTLNSGNLRSDINNESGYGLGLNTYLGRTNLSLEFTGSRISPRTTFTPTNTQFNPITGLRVRMTPITGALQLHWNPRSIVDFYIGGGGAYVMFKPDNGFNPGNTGITSIKFKNEFGPMVNAGLGFGFSPHFGLNFDAKYMWVRANTTTTFNNGVVVGNVGNSERFGLNPFLLSAGLRFGF